VLSKQVFADMILYLVRKYVVIVLVITVFLMLGPVILSNRAPGTVILTAMFWSNLAAVPLTYWELRRHHLWPLYDNLRLPRWGLLTLLAACFECIAIFLLLWPTW